MRKVIQVAVSESWSSSNHYVNLVVLCDDGTMWRMDEDDDWSKTRSWLQIADIPRDEKQS